MRSVYYYGCLKIMDTHHVPHDAFESLLDMFLKFGLRHFVPDVSKVWFVVFCPLPRLSSVNRDSVRVNLDIQLGQVRRNAIAIQPGKVLSVGWHESINKVLQLCARHAWFPLRFHRIFCLFSPIVNVFRIGDLNHQHQIQQLVHSCKIFEKLVDHRYITRAGILDGLKTHAPPFQNYEVYRSVNGRPVLFWYTITSSFVRGFIVTWNIDCVARSATGERIDRVEHQVNVHSTRIPAEF
mmetsp:Transcript_2969/g.4253  ORF Transcript_2969/g.4253 Transcript_2969/m.4253 type:complete len:238 (-) Transcript_2969:732-1445(-)